MRNPFRQKSFKIARPGIVFLVAEIIVTAAFTVTGMGMRMIMVPTKDNVAKAATIPTRNSRLDSDF